MPDTRYIEKFVTNVRNEMDLSIKSNLFETFAEKKKKLFIDSSRL